MTLPEFGEFGMVGNECVSVCICKSETDTQICNDDSRLCSKVARRKP